MFEVFRARKWEALCEDHFLWLMDNVHKLPEFRRRRIIRCACAGGFVFTPAKKRDRSDYRQKWYDKNRERLLGEARLKWRAAHPKKQKKSLTHVN